MKKFLAAVVILSSVLSLIIFSASGIIYLLSNGNKVKSKEGFTYRIYVIDGCQYVGYNDGFSHKGNCTNAAHKFKIN